MFHAFSDLEGIRIAVEMERRGESFYRRAAKVSRSKETVELLNALANDERLHGAEFERLCRAQADSACAKRAYDDETNAYLTAIAADIVFPQGLMALKETGFESPEAVLLTAIASEKDSILFYSELMALTQADQTQGIFSEIIRQERGHMFRLQRQLECLRKNSGAENSGAE